MNNLIPYWTQGQHYAYKDRVIYDDKEYVCWWPHLANNFEQGFWITKKQFANGFGDRLRLMKATIICYDKGVQA